MLQRKAVNQRVAQRHPNLSLEAALWASRRLPASSSLLRRGAFAAINGANENNGQSMNRRVAILGLTATAGLLSGCAILPRSGPLASQIDPAERDGEVEGLVVTLTQDVIDRVNRPDGRGFSQARRAAASIDPDRFRIGDLVDVSVWESGQTGLFTVAGGGPYQMTGAPVDSGGAIFMPFVGRVRAEGATPGELRNRLREALSALTLDPQVDVRLAEPAGKMITVQGAVARPGAYPLQRGALTLAPMLALAGGSALPPEQVEVSIRRDGETEAVMLEDVYRDTGLDVALRPGDLVVLTPIRERFVALGATSSQAVISFPKRKLDLLTALGAARGLRDFDADPTGVFIFRKEERARADALLAGPPPEGLPVGQTRPVVFRLDLTAPGAIFIAQNFMMRDGDAIFATNAPLTELRKVLQLFTVAFTPIEQTTNFAP